MTFRDEITLLLKAGNPMLVIDTYEEDRVAAELQAVLSEPGVFTTSRKLSTWSCTTGLVATQGETDGPTKDVRIMLDRVATANEPAVYMLRDMHAFFGADGHRSDAYVVRALRDIASRNRRTPTPITVILMMPRLVVPWDLRKTVTVVDFSLPNRDELDDLVESMLDANAAAGKIQSVLPDADKQRLVAAAAGLTIAEAENALAAAMVAQGALTSSDVSYILEQKKQAVRTGGVLDVITSETAMTDVGGLENLKQWLAKRDGAWLPDAAAYGVPAPRGLLMTGVPGCGKSMTAMAVASEWGLPLLRLDLGRVLSGIVGSSEHNMRSALQTAEAIAPCVLWIDEIEKGFSGAGSALDSGVSRRIFGTFLTWMQERAEPVFVIATANSIEQLPPEFLRKGRFDEIFFVDLPTEEERLPIWRTHLSQRLAGARAAQGAIVVDDQGLSNLVDLSEGYSGAEIEQCVINALYDGFAAKRPLEMDDLRHAIANMVPLSVTQEHSIATLRDWASNRAVSATSAHGTSGSSDRRSDDSAEPNRRGGRVVDF